MNKINAKQAIPIVFIAALAVSLVTTLVFIQKNNSLKTQLNRTKKISEQMDEMISRLQEDRNKLTRENEKLNADAVSYIGINTRLQEEKEKIQGDSEDLRKMLEDKEAGLEKIKKDLKKLEKKVISSSTKENSDIAKEREELKKKMAEAEENLKKERALYHYNLGVAYSKAGLYDEALLEYKRSLILDKDNPDAYYNLAVIYKDIKEDRDEAAKNYRSYLKLKPDANDSGEVEALIGSL